MRFQTYIAGARASAERVSSMKTRSQEILVIRTNLKIAATALAVASAFASTAYAAGFQLTLSSRVVFRATDPVSVS